MVFFFFWRFRGVFLQSSILGQQDMLYRSNPHNRAGLRRMPGGCSQCAGPLEYFPGNLGLLIRAISLPLLIIPTINQPAAPGALALAFLFLRFLDLIYLRSLHNGRDGPTFPRFVLGSGCCGTPRHLLVREAHGCARPNLSVQPS
jgi:hypothetical protein